MPLDADQQVAGARLFRMTIAHGDDLGEALERAVPRDNGWVNAVGTVADAEVRVAGDGAEPVRTMRGSCSLVSLSGPTGGPYFVLLSRSQGPHHEVVGGALVRARAEVVSAVLLLASQALPEGTQPPPTDGDRPLAPPSGTSTWAQLAAAAAAASRADEGPKERPLRGDRVQHFAFGLCDVISAEGDSLRIRAARGPGRIREIRIDVLEVHEPQQRDGKRVFRLAKRG